MELNATDLRRLLSYDPDTGRFTWRVSPTPRVPVGRVAGTPDREGYVRIRIRGRAYKAARLAFLHVLGRWPRHEVDHKNGSTGDDRWSNLREADRATNSLNRSRQATNKSGFKGVCLRAPGKWQASIKVRGRSHYLGLFLTPETAHRAYCAAALRLHGEFARSA